MRVMVNLSGGQGETFARGWKNLKGRYPKRFVVFANLDFTGIDDPGWGERAAAQLERDVQNGAQGLKIFKNFGMTVKDGEGRRVAVGRSAPGPRLGEVRGARDPGADPHGRAGFVLSSRRTATTSAGSS